MDKAILMEPYGSQLKEKAWPKEVKQSFIDSLPSGQYLMSYSISSGILLFRQRIDFGNYGPEIEYPLLG